MAVSSTNTNPFGTGTTTATSSAVTVKDPGVEKAEKLQQQFLQLLLKQLEVQNPLDPVDTSEYTGQLVQYSALEQQIDTNTKLDRMVAAFQQTANLNSFGYIGKEVLIEQPYTAVENGVADWAFQFGQETASTKLTVKNGAGTIIYQKDLGKVPAGSHDFILTRDMLGNGATVKDGEVLVLSIDAADRDGKAISSAIGTRITIDSVDTSGSEPIMGSGNLFFTAGDILKVYAAPKPVTETPATS